MKFPDLEKAAQSDAREAIQGSSLSPEVRSQLISALPRVTLSALTPESVHAFIKGSAETALQSSNLPSEDKKNAAEAVANSVTRTVLQNSPIKRPPDVSCGMSVLPWNITRWAFGREIADNFIVVQVTVRNLNNQQQFLVHDVELAVDTQPGIFNRFGSSTDQATIDGVALTAEEGWSSRAFWLRLATLVGSIVSAASVPVGGPSFKDAAGIYSGAFIPALNKFLKDHTAEQIARLDSAAFSNSQSRKVIVSKNDSATFDTFLPVHSLTQIDWEHIYYYKTGAKTIDPGADFILKKAKNYKDWSALALLGLNNSTYVIVSGAHISETPSEAQISSILCPPTNSATIDLTQVTGDSITCSMKGTNLQVVAQIILENAVDPNDHVYAVGTSAISGADPSQATVSFKLKDLEQLKASNNKVFYELKGGAPQATSLNMTVLQVVSITPSALAFPNQTVGTTSTAQSSTLTNRGKAALAVTAVTLTGTNPEDFTQASTCGKSVASSADCTITVTFKPTGTGSRTASVSIADDGPGSPQSIGLTGIGLAVSAPTATLSPSTLTFGTQTVNTAGAPQNVTLTNSGTAALTITGITISGENASDFGQTNTCGASVPSGGSCIITVTFKPTSAGSRAASIKIADNASNTPQTVSLTGTGK